MKVISVMNYKGGVGKTISKNLFNGTGKLKPFVGNIFVADLVQRVSEMLEVVDNNDLPF